MKVAWIVPGGVDRSGDRRVIPCLLWMIERIARVHEVHVFVLGQEPRRCRYRLAGAEVHNAGRFATRLQLLADVWSEHRRDPFDLIHAVWAAPPGVLAALLGRLLNIPVLLRLTGGDLAALPQIAYGQRASWRGRWWLKAAIAGASHVVVPSASMQSAAEALGTRAERLPWGVALDRWPPCTPRPRRPGAPARLAHVGSLNRVKDQATLLHAAKILVNRGVAFRLDIVGEDTLGGEVQRLAASLGLESYVRFQGFLVQDQVREIIREADMLVVSSLHEADPIVALEAAISGTPVVGTAVGHLVDWAPEAAIVAPPGDADGLAEAIQTLLYDDPRRLAIATAAQALALSEDADWSARQVLAIYERLTPPASSPSN
jgi:glycosyltransferase involved in cell wall biosynthesis